MNYYGIPSKVYQNPYYSIESDAPERPREYAGLVFHLKGGIGVSVLEDFQSGVVSEPSTSGQVLSGVGVHGWEYASLPPSVREVRKWLARHKENFDLAKPKKSSQARLYRPDRLIATDIIADYRTNSVESIRTPKQRNLCTSLRTRAW